MNYVPVAIGTILDDSAGTHGYLNAGTSSGNEATSQDYIVMPIWKDASYFDTPSKDVKDGTHNENDDKDKSEDDSSPKEVNAARQHVNTASLEVNIGCFELNTVDPSLNTASSSDPHSPTDMFKLGASDTLEATHSAFLYGTIEEEVYVTHLPGFKDPDHPDKVYKVVKALYGLHLHSHDVKSASTPVDLEKPLVKDGDANDVDVHLYRSMIGSLMYLTTSRLDIMFAVYACAKF
uniref:Ribonuclease H-like domain, reverse transcriptase, RNA-dependent DNA polymerase n=1 Tax=Tanacetum cinerariifolium TaxID=118510 RepID=A0A6L2MXH4_TANCI|nr:ribonuclease H-like domain, reverse transcriptase, RNA-dependent DNA polymerase [Tanacetum cinerariifolium]